LLDRAAYHIWAELPANVQPQEHPGLRGLVLVERVNAGPTHVTFNFFGGGEITYTPTADGEHLECGWQTWFDEW
jgi:hypothetical protein